MTTDPNHEMSLIHNRMPVILDERDLLTWLDPNLPQNEIVMLLRPYDDNKLEIYQVDKAVNSVRNNSLNLLRPINS